jgi:hypothetical protein
MDVPGDIMLNNISQTERQIPIQIHLCRTPQKRKKNELGEVWGRMSCRERG